LALPTPRDVDALSWRGTAGLSLSQSAFHRVPMRQFPTRRGYLLSVSAFPCTSDGAPVIGEMWIVLLGAGRRWTTLVEAALASCRPCFHSRLRSRVDPEIL